MKILTIVLSILLVACSPSLIDEKPSKALEYAHSLLNLKIQEIQLNNELHQAEIEDKEYEKYERSTLPNLIRKHQATLIKSQEEYLASYKEYEIRVATIRKSNNEQERSIDKYNNQALAEFNKAKTDENARVRTINKSLQAEYNSKIQKELPKQKERIDKMKAYEKEQLEASIIENRKIYSSLRVLVGTPAKSKAGRKKWTEATKDMSVYASSMPLITQPSKGLPENLVSQAKSLYESTFRACIGGTLNSNCKQFADMFKRGSLIIPKLYSKENFESALAINTIPKPVLEKVNLRERDALKKANFIDEPVKPERPFKPRKPANPYSSQKAKIRQLKNSLMDVTEDFSRLNNVATNSNLDIDWDDTFQEMKESEYWDISGKTFRDDALIVILKNNTN
ncbi:hypothetical protein A9Q74_09885 [Colwellia sp. 39_35_sub15_T18]|nr:hypothetical protein A9Q74_09885 [Colwellia sp. 39_35_sub15_T18]